MNINLIRVAPCKICVGMKFRTGAGLGEGGVAIDHKKFLCTQKYIFKKTRSKPMNRRKKPNEMIKNNPFFFKL